MASDDVDGSIAVDERISADFAASGDVARSSAFEALDG